jgi:hypothetical protein
MLFKSHRSRKPNRILPFLEELETRALPSNYLSTNWSGYAVESPSFTNPAGHVITKVQGSWKVPTVSSLDTGLGWSSTWVGIDGFSSNSVEQIGTEQDTALTSAFYGQPQYYAWIEMYPAYPLTIQKWTDDGSPATISPNDSITASVIYTGLPGDTTSNSPFNLKLTDVTTGHYYTTSQTYTGAQRSSAEWIEEAPSSRSGVLPLADFQSVSFTGNSTTVNGSTGGISSFPNASINMINSSFPFQTIASTSTPVNPDGSFSVTFTGSTSGGGGGGGHHRHSPATIVQLLVPNNPAVPTVQPNVTVVPVVQATGQVYVPAAISQTPAPAAIHGYLSVAPTPAENMDDMPKKDDQQGDGATTSQQASPSTTRGLLDGPGGTMSREALDEFFANPAAHEQSNFEETPALESTAPIIDVVTGAELSFLLLGAYLGNPIKAKETEDNTKRKVKWL